MLSRLFHGSIRKKLAVLFLLSALPAMIIIVLTGFQNRREAIARAEQELLAFSRSLADSQTQATSGTRTFLEGLARLPEVRESDAAACAQLFSNITKLNPSIGALHLVDTRGDLVASGNAKAPANFSHTKHFRDALATKSFATGEYIVGVTIRLPVFTFGHPVLDDGGRVIGILLTSIRLDRYGELFRYTHFPENSFVGISDHNGIRLYRFPDNPSVPIGNAIKAEVFEAARQGPAGLITEIGSDGVERIHAYHQLRLDPDAPPYMYIIVGAPKATIFAGVRQTMARDLALLLLIMGLTLLSGWYLGGKKLGLSLEELAAAAKKIGAGDCSVRVSPVPEITEVDVLAKAFNAMAGSLSASIGERERAEEELRRREHFLSTILETTQDGFWTVDTSGVVTNVNEAFCRMTGYAKEEFQKLGLSAIEAMERPEETALRMRRIIENGSELFETRHRRKDGTTFDVEISTTWLDMFGGIFVAFCRDITERKRTESALRDSEENYRQLFEAESDAVFLIENETGRILQANTAACALYGYSHSELLSMRNTEVSAEPEQTSRASTRTPAVPDQVVRIPLRYHRKKDGTVFPVEITARFFIHHDRHVHIVAVRDITERRKSEEAILKAKEAAEAASVAKSEFLANMSHEIRTPLNGIVSMLQLLETSGVNAEQHEFCTLALQSTNRLTRLLSDILDLSRVEAGKMQIRADRFNLPEAISQAVDLFAPIAVQTGVELRHHWDPALPTWAVGDPVRLQQILTNLVGNAFKFTRSGHVSVEAYPLPAKSEGQVRIFFSVSDSGCGMSDEVMTQLFEPFTQGGQGFTRSHQGAGLGLSICKHLVTLMGGNIAVESEVGTGSSFHFCITVGSVSEPPAEEAIERRPAPAGAQGRVLVAEDDEVSLYSTRKLLEKGGYEVAVARNGQEALELHEKEGFDLILMDVQMPVMDGIEATRRIRESGPEARRAVPIIALTAYAMVGDRERFLAAGMNGHIAKPVEFDALLRAVGKFLKDGD